MAQENDVVLIYFEEQPMAFARIEAITPDAKPEWFQVNLLLLQVPLQTVTWILRPAYIDGGPFTMGGKQLRIERVVAPDAPGGEQKEPVSDSSDSGEKNGTGKVVSLFDQKKQNER